jgi:chaperonin cofactor prefoldin
MSESTSLEIIARRLDGLQNNVSGVNRRLIMLESSLTDRMGALEARMTELEDRADTLVKRIGALEVGVNSLILLVERIAKAS